jgi:hypothetical protein
MKEWADRIRDLITSARLICVTVGRSQSLLWEIGAIRAAGALDRAIFLLPPTGKIEQRRRLLVLAFALGIDYAPLDVTYPDRDVLAVVFPGGDSASGAIPVVITGSAPDDVGYEAAIGAWALAVIGNKRSFPAELRELCGHVVAAKTLPGTAYGVAAAGKKLYVTLARQNAVAELDAGTLASVRTIPVPAGPRDRYGSSACSVTNWFPSDRLPPGASGSACRAPASPAMPACSPSRAWSGCRCCRRTAPSPGLRRC